MNSNEWAQYWKDRWNNQNTRWHQDEFEPLLVQYFPKIEPTTVLAPLCGKSKDMIYLASLGHQVIGVELSELACRAFFEENQIEFVTREQDSFLVFDSERIRLFCGDFFGLGIKHTGELRVVYDRAALIALPPDLRKKYVTHLTGLLSQSDSTNKFILLVTINYDQPNFSGPPFSIPKELVQELYSKAFEVQILSNSNEQVQLNSQDPQTVTAVEERAYLLSGS